VVGSETFPVAVGLGYASLYNHAPQANATYRIAIRKAQIEIRAWRDINAGEEITINYNGRPDDPSPVWMPPSQE
jgi:SET domain-containing protein